MACWPKRPKQHNDVSKHVPPVDQINHLRDALVANMVGVIFALQQQYPGVLILEDLDQDLIQKHFQQLNLDISGRLERSLYQKFQTIGWVPPHIKDLIRIREKSRQDYSEALRAKAEENRQKTIENKRRSLEKEKKESEFEAYRQGQIDEEYNVLRKKEPYSNQVGAIVYVDEYKTSKNCPYCGSTMQWSGWDKKLKFEQHRFLCGKRDKDPQRCGFDTDEFGKEKHEDPPKMVPVPRPNDLAYFSEIDDPDKVAAYNVAQKVLDYKGIRPFAQKTPDKGQSKQGKSKQGKGKRP